MMDNYVVDTTTYVWGTLGVFDIEGDNPYDDMRAAVIDFEEKTGRYPNICLMHPELRGDLDVLDVVLPSDTSVNITLKDHADLWFYYILGVVD